MATNRIVTAVLAGSAATLLLVLQFVPWGGVSDSFASDLGGVGFSGSSHADAYTWSFKGESTTSTGPGTSSQGGTTGWYDEDLDDASGIGSIRTAVPLLLAGLVGCALATLLGLVAGSRVGAVVATLAALLAIVGTVLFTAGVGDLFDGRQEWSVGFYLAIFGCVAAVAAAVAGFLPGPAATRRAAA